MSIQAVRLRNFRGFQDAGIQLKPLTVLLGPNSAGKSAFGHALAAMAHAQWFHSGSGQASLTPAQKDADDWPVDLGNLPDLRTDGVVDRVYIGLETNEGLVDLGFGFELPLPSARDLRLSYVAHPRGLDESAAVTTTVRAQGEVPGAQSEVVSLGVSEPQKSPGRLVLRRINENMWHDEGEDSACLVGLDGLMVMTVQHQPGGTSRQLSGAARDEVRTFLKGLTYLRATRKRPSRSYRADTGPRQAIGYAGEWTATILSERRDEIVPFVRPPQIPNTVDEAAATLDAPWDQGTMKLLSAVDEWLQLLHLATSIESTAIEGSRGQLQIRATLPGQQSHNITEIGFGISQIVPVLVAGLLQPENGILIVDLPEAHLHPRPQAVLADFFCSLALSGRTTLVETHSEMFFHRLRLRAEMNPELLGKIEVYFIDEPKDGDCCQPRSVGLTSKGQLRWPMGFLAEAWDTEKHIRIMREARRGRA
ncbi:MAG: AAA family ATPase [Terriglobia bacterium]|jgi:predicted ATPase